MNDTKPPPVLVTPAYLPPPTGGKCSRCGEDELDHERFGLVCRSGHRIGCGCPDHSLERECPALVHDNGILAAPVEAGEVGERRDASFMQKGIADIRTAFAKAQAQLVRADAELREGDAESARKHLALATEAANEGMAILAPAETPPDVPAPSEEISSEEDAGHDHESALELLETEATFLAYELFTLGREIVNILFREIVAGRATGPTDTFKSDVRFVLEAAATSRNLSEHAGRDLRAMRG